jgi:hypothetical protein
MCIIRMTCRNFGIDQAEQQSSQHRDYGNQQEKEKRDDGLFLHYLYRGIAAGRLNDRHNLCAFVANS